MIGYEIILLLLTFKLTIGSFRPEQIHLSLAGNGRDIVVTWSTPSAVNTSIVEYGIKQVNQRQYGTYKIFTDGGSAKRQQEIHRVTLPNLKPSTIYYYRVGSEKNWSPIFHFRTFPASNVWSPSFAIYGDLGLEGGYSIPHLKEEVANNVYDAIFHNGDFGYNLDESDGNLGDRFLREIEPIAAYLPYMTSVGNHEKAYHYRERFTMPGDTEGLYYSVNIGPVHFIVFSSEFYYFLNEKLWYTMEHVERQYKWIIQDLEKSIKNRNQQPWIIAMAHRPMYCTSTGKLGDDCTKIKTKLRVGLGNPPKFGLEDVFYKYGVDILFWAHEHTYERFYPMYNYSGFVDHNPYVNPKAPVHILTGSAGCREKEDEFVRLAPVYSAARTRDFGYTRLKVYNSTHAYLEQVSVKDYPMFKRSVKLEYDRKVVDRVWIVKDNIFTYAKNCFN